MRVVLHACVRRFHPSVSQQQEQLHTWPLPVNQSEQQLSRCSSSGTSSGSKSCSRCGETFGARYTKEGKVREETPSYDSDDDIIMAGGDDTEDYIPHSISRKGRKKGTQAGRGAKRTARMQQLPPLPPHGAGHHGAKRQRVAPRKLQDTKHEQQEGQSEPHVRQSYGAAAAAADAGAGAGDGGVLCSLCMREIALQEVEQACGTTLIVVPANILVQVGAAPALSKLQP